MRQPETATRDSQSRSGLPQSAAVMLDRLRTQRPAVHCITNTVAQNFTANFLLAAGCVPSMTLSSEEIAAFVERAQALLINLGTFDRERREATEIVVETATRGTLVQLRHKNSDTAPDPAQAARELRAVVKYALKRRETS